MSLVVVRVGAGSKGRIKRVGGNDYYVTERPNPDALTHSEIFKRLVIGGRGISGTGPIEPLVTNGEALSDALRGLAGMMGSLAGSYQAGSTELAMRAINRVGSHVHGTAAQATQVADGFTGYVEAYQEARSRVPPPLPFAEQLDAVAEYSPDILARLPGLAQLEEEHAERTQEAREAYRRLDQAAVAADAATPRFPLMAGPVTSQVETGSFSTAPPAGARWPGARGHVPAATASSAVGPAGSAAPSSPTLPPPAVGGGVSPTPTPGAGSSAGGTVGTPLPTVPASVGGGSGAGGGSVPPGMTGGSWSRLGPDDGNRQTQRGSRAGGAVEGGHGRGAPGSGSSWRGSGAGLPVGETPAVRGGGIGGRGVPGPANSGLGPFGPGGRKEEDREHRRASFLEADESADSLFGTDQKTAPPVIGGAPPGAA